MNCLSPESIKRPGTDAFGKGNSVRDRVTVPCGKCAACLSNQRSDWTFRLKQELKQASSAYFITLTYNNENVPYVGETSSLIKKDLQDFIKRLRRYHDLEADKYQKDSNNALKGLRTPQIRYFAVGEYGPETLRPHYHGLFFNISDKVIQEIDKVWNKGYIKVGDVNTASIHYTTKYVINRKMDIPGVERPFSIMSRRPGIGSAYIDNRTLGYHRQSKGQQLKVTEIGGIQQRMPRYYKNKIFTDDEIRANQMEVQAKMDSHYDEDIKELLTHGDDIGKVIHERKINQARRIKEKLTQNQTL